MINRYSSAEIFNVTADVLYDAVTNFGQYQIWSSIIVNPVGEIEASNKIFFQFMIDSKVHDDVVSIVGYEKNKSVTLEKQIYQKIGGKLVYHLTFKQLRSGKTQLIHTWIGKGLLTNLFWQRISKRLLLFDVYNQELKNHISFLKKEKELRSY